MKAYAGIDFCFKRIVLYVSRHLNGRHKNHLSLRPPRLCGESVGRHLQTSKYLNLAKDPKFIPGIYNYCDRWCERCPFTSRCLNCSLVEEQFGDLKENDEMNEAFWQRFSGMLQNTLAMITEMAKEEGIDVDSADNDKNCNNGDTIKEFFLADLISHTLKNYANSVADWFNSNDYLFYEKEAELNRIHLASHNNPV